ncbi:MAG: nucleoside kinase [Bacilli bacterium]|nr:nucleoside kinase [Bacilli bacterium]
MLESIKVKVFGKETIIKKGITLLELSKMYDDLFKHKIIIAKVDSEYHELNDQINKSCDIEFFDLTTRYANRIYLNGLVFLTNYCFQELFKKKGYLKTRHSADKGLYMEASCKLTKEMVIDLENKMNEVVKDNLNITKVTILREDAIAYFNEIGDVKKAGLLEYMTNTYVNLYRMGNSYNYMFSLMPSETSCLNEFKLAYLNEEGFILRYPTIYSEGEIPKYKHHPKLFEVFKESKEWCKLMNLETSVDLNNIITTGKISDLIKITETLYSNKLLNIAREIASNSKVKIVLIAGPSSSGKTTTTKKLSMYLKSFGLKPKMLSMDDFFVEREDTPKKENGEYDFECLEAIDLELFNKTLDKLLKGEKVLLPMFNFITGQKEYNEEMILDKNDVLLIEGIHCLNPKILSNIEASRKLKIYLSALTEINIDEDNRISTTDNRLIRRLIRDHYTRGYEPHETLDLWESVREGEEKYIFPYQDEADITLNTGLVYEFPVLKVYGLPLLYTVSRDNEFYEDAKRLIRLLEIFLPVPSDEVPNDSILREFIGGSYFK